MKEFSVAVTADFPLSHDALALLKRNLHARLPNIPSSHLAEAIARGLDFQTNAALQAHLRATPGVTAEFISDRFSGRLVELRHAAADDISDDVRLVRGLVSAQADPGLTPRAPLERCASYGVRIVRNGKGEVFAHHNVAGVLGPYYDENEAAAQACTAWDI
jgi:hypothetical protein